MSKISEPNIEDIKQKVENFLNTEAQREKRIAFDYYNLHHDISHKTVSFFDPKTAQKVVDRRAPNHKIIVNLYGDAVDEKANYIFGKAFKFSLNKDNPEYEAILRKYFNPNFHILLHELAVDAINCCYGWLIPYINSKGELKFNRITPIGVYPDWLDSAHTELRQLIRAYSLERAGAPKINEIPTIIEVYRADKMYRYEYKDNELYKYQNDFECHYIDFGEVYGDWSEIPAIPFKFLPNEKPLIRVCKDLLDALELILSSSADDIQKSLNNAIFVLSGYQANDENLNTALETLKRYNVMVLPEDGKADMLQPKMEFEAYKLIIEVFRKFISYACRNTDLDTLKNAGQYINQATIEAAYSRQDNDANILALQFEGALQKVLTFINKYLIMTHQFKPEFANIEVKFTFNKNQIINTTEKINNLRNSVGILSLMTILENHPYVTDPLEELKRLEKEKAQELKLDGFFANNNEEKQKSKDDET